MTTKTKKITFWVIIALIVIGILSYLKFAAVGDTLMSVFIGSVGVIVGWIAKCFYDKYIKDDLAESEGSKA